MELSELRPLSSREQESLKESLRACGQLVPIVRDRKTGIIADGENRARILKELGKKPIYEDRDFKSHDDIRFYCLVVNTERRQLSPEQLEETRRWQVKTSLAMVASGKTQAEAAKFVGSSQQAVSAWVTGARRASKNTTRGITKSKPKRGRRTQLSLDDKKEIATLVKKQKQPQAKVAAEFDVSQKTVSNIVAVEVKKEEKEEARLEAAEKNEINNQIIVGDFREHADKIADGSLSLIFTDPPYNREASEMLPDLADFADRKLAEGGSLLCYVGNTQLPAALDALRTKLRYWWTIACVHAGNATVMREYAINTRWKPVLWFVKVTRSSKDMVSDVMSGGQEKTHHEWQQAESEAAYWIEHLCPRNGIVCDPFLGGGTTAVAAQKLKRKWIAFEIEETSAKIASGRLKEL